MPRSLGEVELMPALAEIDVKKPKERRVWEGKKVIDKPLKAD